MASKSNKGEISGYGALCGSKTVPKTVGMEKFVKKFLKIGCAVLENFAKICYNKPNFESSK